MEEWLRLGSEAAVCGQPAATGGPSNPLPFSKKAVVMGMATDYQWPDLRNFVVSLRYTKYTGDIVLFVSSDAKSDDVLMWRLRHFNVTVVAVSPTFPYFEKDSLPRMMIECLRPPPMPNLHVVNQRFHVMELWLTAYRSRYDFVFISDTRDVIFQRDPFDWHDRKIEDKLYVALDTMAINRHGLSATWVQMAFGREGYAKIKSETVSCSGTTYGSTDQMLRYLQRMNSWIRKVIEAHKHRLRKDETVDRDIADLAIHNYIIYQLDWDNRLEFLDHANSPVLTMGSLSEFKSQSPPLQVLNDDRQVVNVIHQYDRYQDITKMFDTRYSFLERQSLLFNVSLISINMHQ